MRAPHLPAATGCFGDAPESLEVAPGQESTRCPRAVDFLPETDDLLALYHEGHLEHLTAAEKRAAPARLIAALEWVKDVWRDHRRRLEEQSGTR